jgi:hypothetical protein
VNENGFYDSDSIVFVVYSMCNICVGLLLKFKVKERSSREFSPRERGLSFFCEGGGRRVRLTGAFSS